MRLEVSFEVLADKATEIPRGSLLVSAKVLGAGLEAPRELMLGPFLPVESWDPWVNASELTPHGFLSRHVERGEGGARLLSYGAGSRLFLGPGQDLLCTFEVPGVG